MCGKRIMFAFDENGVAHEYDVSSIEDISYYKGYLQGQKELWEVMREIVTDEGELSNTDLIDLFGTYSLHRIFKDNDAPTVMKRVEWYKHRYQDFQVGDEVVDRHGCKYCVIAVYKDSCKLINSNGEISVRLKKDFRKTDKKYDIKKILDELKERSRE